MQNRKVNFETAGLPAPGKQRWPSKVCGRTESQARYEEKCLALLAEEEKKIPGFKITMHVNHRNKTVEFSYSKKDVWVERLGQTLKSIEARMETDDAKIFFNRRKK